MKKIAIIGAGVAGATCAKFLSAHESVTVFEKSRGVGGRLSTRRSSPFFFDHGAPFFIVRSKPFKSMVDVLIQRQIILPYNPFGKTELVYVAQPGMNALVKAIMPDVALHLGCRIHSLSQSSKGWLLYDDHSECYGPFDWVISTAPPVQTLDLFPDFFSKRNLLSAIPMQACFALMLGVGFENTLANQVRSVLKQSIALNHAILDKVVLNHTKPGRQGGISLVVYANGCWSQSKINDEISDVLPLMMNEVSQVLGLNMNLVDYHQLHKWRFARLASSQTLSYGIDVDHQLAFCGDWCLSGDVDSAYMSALSLAEAIHLL